MSFLNYLLFRIFTFPFGFLPYSILHKLGRVFGWIIFHGYPKYRKRALSNLALATDLSLSPDEIKRLALQSIQSKAITALEYPRLYREKNIHSIVTCDNPEVADQIMQSGKSVIFFCGHQANWELLFLEGTRRMQGVAIGRPIKNKHLYAWVIRMREKFGGKIVEPKNAYREMMRALKQGKFVGIVGDQGMPDSGFSSPFLGRRAWTSPLPALLSKRSGCPIVVATIRRIEGKYRIHYSQPIWPERSVRRNPVPSGVGLDEPSIQGSEDDASRPASLNRRESPQFDGGVLQIDNQMEQVLAIFQESIKACPQEWLWTHNKWKQQLPGILKKRLRHDALAFIFKTDPTPYFDQIRNLYPGEHITAFVPQRIEAPLELKIEVKTHQELFIRDYRFKLVIDFTDNKKAQKHFSRLSALDIYSFKTPEEFLEHARR